MNTNLKKFTSGDSLSFYVNSQYDGYYNMELTIKNATGISLTLDGVYNSNYKRFDFLILPSVSKEIKAGDYAIAVVTTKEVDNVLTFRKQERLGNVTVLPAVDDEGFDDTIITINKLRLNIIRDKLFGTLSAKFKSYELEGRKIENFSINELEYWEQVYSDRVAEEDAIANGQGGGAIQPVPVEWLGRR